VLPAGRGEEEGATLLLYAGANIEAVNEDGQTALHLAAAEGHSRLTGALLAAGANADSVDARGLTPLSAAINGTCAVSRIAVVTALLDGGADPAFARPSGELCQWRVPTGDTDTGALVPAGLLLVPSIATPPCPSLAGATALHDCALLDLCDVIDLLASRGAPVDAANVHGVTPLHCAAKVSAAMAQLHGQGRCWHWLPNGLHHRQC